MSNGWRDSTWTLTRWKWIGWVSSLRLRISQTSVLPAATTSVGASTYSRPNAPGVTDTSVPRNWMSRPYASKASLSVRYRTGTPPGTGVGTPGACVIRNGSVGVNTAGNVTAGSDTPTRGLTRTCRSVFVSGPKPGWESIAGSPPGYGEKASLSRMRLEPA